MPFESDAHVGSGRAPTAVALGWAKGWQAWCRHCLWAQVRPTQDAAFRLAERHRCQPQRSQPNGA